MPLYRVMRQMLGDRHYTEGDVRELSLADAAPLLARGALSPILPDTKVETAPANKLARAPRNKAKA